MMKRHDTIRPFFFLDKPNLVLCFLRRRLLTNFGIGLELFIVSGIVNPGCTSTGISTQRKGCVPVHGTFRRAGNRLSSRHCLFGSLSWVEGFEDRTIPVTLFGGWGVVREAISSIGKHLIRNFLVGNIPKVVDPSVTDSVTKLFFLSPQNFVGEVRVIWRIEGFTDRPFLDAGVFLGYIRSLTNHLLSGIQVHCHLQEVSIQEGDTRLHTPCTHCLVTTQAIVSVKTTELINRLVEEFLLVGCLMEVKVSAKNFIGTLTTDDHLNPHGLDFSRHEVHGSRSSNSGKVISFEATNDVRNGI
mmetsp:Transcript_21984/g.45222  ORF Transcript_21984/g.45222 Transcript_21984/m.45222 type:complete len:300 (-) Transcript_21984:1045-1944(-)